MSSEHPAGPRSLSRRHFLAVAAGATGALGAARPAAALDRVLGAADARVGSQSTALELKAAPTTIDLAGKRVKTWAYNGTVPGPLLRARAGETVRVRVDNQLGEDTSVHWHGIALANAMDGVPDVTQAPIASGASFDYEFVTPDPGTYFFHPHVGLQLDRGLYAPLIVDDPADPGGYDAEWIVVLDDWTDGVGPSPAKILSRLRNGMAMGSGTSMGSGMDMGSGSGMDTGSSGSSGSMSSMMSDVLGGMAGDVAYPLYLINGRPPKDPETFRASAGQRIRLRLINAASDTAFRFAVGGHRLSVTHADGYPVAPIEADAVLLGMGERIDALVTCQGDVNPVVARAEGKGKSARAVLRAGSGSISRWKVPELDGRLVTATDLTPAPSAALVPRAADRTHKLVLGGNDMKYEWTINGETYSPTVSYPVAQGERVRLEFRNTSTMWHPMHLHGHTFAVMTGADPGVRKDTVIVKPGGNVAVEFDADNAGAWMMHCHNTYHLETGMMTTIRYT